jgi:hypothetical protein
MRITPPMFMQRTPVLLALLALTWCAPARQALFGVTAANCTGDMATCKQNCQDDPTATECEVLLVEVGEKVAAMGNVEHLSASALRNLHTRLGGICQEGIARACAADQKLGSLLVTDLQPAAWSRKSTPAAPPTAAPTSTGAAPGLASSSPTPAAAPSDAPAATETTEITKCPNGLKANPWHFGCWCGDTSAPGGAGIQAPGPTKCSAEYPTSAGSACIYSCQQSQGHPVFR